MGRRLIGIAVTAVALYFWGFLYWGINPLPYQTWKTTADDAAAQETLRQLFPESGLYSVPSVTHSMEELAALYAQGPQVLAFVVQNPGGPTDPTLYVAGFLQQVLTAVVLVFLLPFAHGLAGRLKLALVAGIASIVIIDLTDLIWWQMALDWKVYQMIYNLTVWLIGAAVLSGFVGPRTAEP